ncbi:sulfatase-like hydrolase/transferase [Streptomyces sp. NPDC051642]|uniref:sulfatase-like hydrolase/transferase n=1 Tax=Streptomyces sp. NPDC051642 TaxID=3154646 RepID=UPI003442A8D8
MRRRIQAWREKHPVAARVLSWIVTLLAAVLVHVCLQMPTTVNSLKLTEFMRLPAEAIMGAVVLISLPRRPRIVLAAVSGVLAAVVAILNMLDMGFNEYLGRGFNVILDWSLFGDAQSYLKDTFGGPATTGITVGLVLFVLLLITLVALATVRLANLLAAHKANASRGALIAGTAWITCMAFGLQISGVPLAADHTAAILKLRTVAVRNTLRDEAEFKKVAKVDAFGNTPGSQLVPDLRGKDMIFTFIESYGRSAIEDPIMAPGVDSTLAADTKALSKAGFAAKSGWLTSATYGGSSWLGHSTTMSGLWVSNQRRYRTVMASDHLSLTDAFKKTGDYDTVGVMPGIQKGWPEQSFYGLDKVYNAFQLGYQGPKFSWSTMPDQYALEQFQKQVHSKPRTDGKSLMSLLILTSSHQPWAPIPKLVPWDQLGNGSIFDSIEKAGNKASSVIADTTKSRQEYGKSIQYSVNSLTQWLERYGNDNTVLVFLGDHQPIARVSGNHASRDVPISIVAKDPKVLEKIDGWNWSDGLRPAHNAPVWKMSAFRDKFLTAYGSTPHPKTN